MALSSSAQHAWPPAVSADTAGSDSVDAGHAEPCSHCHADACRLHPLRARATSSLEASTPTRCSAPGPLRRTHSNPEACSIAMDAEVARGISIRVLPVPDILTPRASIANLPFLRRFSVAEQDVLVCNRIRYGVDPMWFRHRRDHDHRARHLLTVEDARLAAACRIHTRLHPPPRETVMESANTVSAMSDKVLPLDDDPHSMPHPESPREPTPSSSDVVDAVCPPPAPSDARHGTMKNGRYLIRESFAKGSYGRVCAGKDLPSQTEVVVKIIPKSVLISTEEKLSVGRECAIHRSLDHPNIIKMIDVFEDELVHYLVLERADGGPLSAHMTFSGIHEQICRQHFRQLLLALEYLHDRRIVHHDVNPHNILLHSTDGIKLCDFGASRSFGVDEQGLHFTGVFGTPNYIAPELLLGSSSYGPAVDLFSAGILLFELVFGYAPFYPPSACIDQPLEFPANTTASTEVVDLIERLLSKDPAKRPTASQVLEHPWLQEQEQQNVDTTASVADSAVSTNYVRTNHACRV